MLAFDVYGTLIDPSAIGFKLHELVGDKSQTFNQLWRDKQLEYSFRKAAMDQFNHFDECTRMALQYCNEFLKTALTDEQMQQLMAAYLELPPFPEVPVKLKELKQEGHQVFAFSNGRREDLEILFERSGLLPLFDQVISVDEVRTFKPAPKVYELLISKANVPPSEIYLVSGNAFDIIGAGALSIKTIWVKRNPDAVMDPFGYQPDVVVESLEEIRV